MLFGSNFRGKIFQVIEALDYGDAVSNQAVALDGIFKEMKFESVIYSQWYHPSVEALRSNLDELDPSDEDIVLLHYACYTGYTFPYVQKLRCTKVCIYHNITPHTFFQPGTEVYELCLKGREQLREVVRDCHYFWGDSSFNLQEIIEMGASADTCSLVPIVVRRPTMQRTGAALTDREPGAWVFLGRIAANKGHGTLLDFFHQTRVENPLLAQSLYIVGNYNESDPCYQALKAQIDRLNLFGCVTITGKVSDAEVANYLARASVYVSMSEHEGFGVPLIEAAFYDLPVVALRNTAVSETMGPDALLGDSAAELLEHVRLMLSDENERKIIVEKQKRNADRFSRGSVAQTVVNALSKLLPGRLAFKTVSVVICTLDRCYLLERCLDYLQYQTNQNFEVVVVNGPSTDATDEVIEKYRKQIKIVRNPERNLSKSRNLGIEISDGDLIAFIDDDAIPFDDWIDTLLWEFSARPMTHVAIGGPAYFSGTMKFQAQDIGINRFAETKVNIDSAEIGTNGWERSMLGTNTCFRADVLRKVQGFDEQFDYFLDESEIAFRLQASKYIVGYADSLYLRHEFAQSENRGGKYKFNWYSICKNTAYFIAAYSGLEGAELRDYIVKRVRQERVAPLEVGLESGEIAREEFDSCVHAIYSGVEQGIVDASGFPRTRSLASRPGDFQTFSALPSYPLLGRDLNRLHICIVSKEFPPFVSGGGIGTLYYHLASELLLMGHHVTVVVPGDIAETYRQGRLIIRYQPLHHICEDTVGAPAFIRNINWGISALHAVAEIHNEQSIDVVDSALWDSESLAIALIERTKRPPLVLRLVTPFRVASRLNDWAISKHEMEFFEASERAVIANADGVVPISQSISGTIQSEYEVVQDARWVICHCGIAYWPSFDVWTGYTELKVVNGKPLSFAISAKIILFLGRLERRKGVDLLLAAANEILSCDRHAHLVLAGKDTEGWSNSIQGFEKDISERVHFVGEVEDGTREKLLNAAYCVVFPSRYESFGLVPLEAFVHGTPVVATNAGAIPEVVEEGKSGLLFHPEDSAALAKCVTRLLLDQKLRERLSSGARQRIRHFSSRRSAIRAISLYESLVSRGLSRGGRQFSVLKNTVYGGNAGYSVSYHGSHRRMLTKCGRRQGRSMESTGSEGFLLYGPYVELQPGTYKAQLFGTVGSAGTPSAFADVLVGAGHLPTRPQRLTQAKIDGHLLSVGFRIQATSQVEVRVWVPADAEVSIRKVVIFSVESCSL